MDLGEFYGNIRLIFSGSLKYSTFDKGRREAPIQWKLFGIFIKYLQDRFQTAKNFNDNRKYSCNKTIPSRPKNYDRNWKSNFTKTDNNKMQWPNNIFPHPSACFRVETWVFTFKLLMLLNSIQLSQTGIRRSGFWATVK